MMSYNKFLILPLLFLINCKQYREVRKAEKMVDQGVEYVNSPEAKTISSRIDNEKEISKNYIRRITETESNTKIESAKRIISVSDSLIETIEKIKFDLAKLHVTKDDERSYKMINQYMIQEGNGLKFKEAISKSIDKMIKIALELGIAISADSLPLKIYNHMEKDGKTWEEYNFGYMPYGATKPIFEKLKNDAILSKLLVLEKIAT